MHVLSTIETSHWQVFDGLPARTRPHLKIDLRDQAFRMQLLHWEYVALVEDSSIREQIDGLRKKLIEGVDLQLENESATRGASTRKSSKPPIAASGEESEKVEQQQQPTATTKNTRVRTRSEADDQSSSKQAKSCNCKV